MSPPPTGRTTLRRHSLGREWPRLLRHLITGLVVISGIALAQPVAAASFTFNTSDSQFTPGFDNQGWWSATALNTNTNTSYFTGERDDGAILRSFFTFDLSSLNLAGQTITAATLEVARYAYDSNDANETVAFFDVSTDAATLNNNTGSNAAIFNDLGSGKNYGTFVVNSYTSSMVLTLSFALNANALADISAAEGQFFSIGGALTSITPAGGENESIFSGSSSTGIQRLTIQTVATAPEPASILLFAPGLAGFVLRKYMAMRARRIRL